MGKNKQSSYIAVRKADEYQLLLQLQELHLNCVLGLLLLLVPISIILAVFSGLGGEGGGGIIGNVSATIYYECDYY